MDVLVLGGGIAGLSCARELAKAGHEPLVLESSDRPGGHLQTTTLDGALLEHGPQGFLGESPGLLEEVDGLGLRDRLLPASEASSNRWILKDGKLCPVPMGPLPLLTSSLLSLGGKLRLLREPWAKGPPDGPESIRDFAIRRIGREAADVMIDAVVTGIFAGDPAVLSVDSCFPKMRRLEREYGSLFKGMMAKKKAGSAAGPAGSRLHSFVGGMQDLVDASVRPLGDRIRLGASVRSFSRNGAGWRVELESGERLEAEGAIVALPTDTAASALRDVAPVTAGALLELGAATVAVVGLVYTRDAVTHPLDGYGFLAPGGKDPAIGCLFESTVFPNRAPAGKVLLRAMVGGARNRPAALEEPARIVDSVHEFLGPILGIRGAPTATQVIVCDPAIPQYDLGHPERVRRIEEELRGIPRFAVAGNSYKGVSVNHLVAHAAEVARRVTG